MARLLCHQQALRCPRDERELCTGALTLVPSLGMLFSYPRWLHRAVDQPRPTRLLFVLGTAVLPCAQNASSLIFLLALATNLSEG